MCLIIHSYSSHQSLIVRVGKKSKCLYNFSQRFGDKLLVFSEGFHAVVEGLSKFNKSRFCGKLCRPLCAPRPLGRYQVHSSSGLLLGTKGWACARCGLFQCTMRISAITRVRRLMFAPCRARPDLAGLGGVLSCAVPCCPVPCRSVLCCAVPCCAGRPALAVLCWP